MKLPGRTSERSLNADRNHPSLDNVLLWGLRGVDLDKSLLGLFVAVVGSLLLPAMRLARVFTPRRTRTRQATAGQGTISEVKEQIDHVPLAPSAGASWFEFRPLTADEKKEFENPLDCQISKIR